VAKYQGKGRDVVYINDSLCYLYKVCRKNPKIRKKFIGYISPEGIIRDDTNISKSRSNIARAVLTGFLAIIFTVVVIVSIFL